MTDGEMMTVVDTRQSRDSTRDEGTRRSGESKTRSSHQGQSSRKGRTVGKATGKRNISR